MKIDKTGKPLPVTPSGGGQSRAPAARPAPSSNHTSNSSSADDDKSVHLGTASSQLQSMEANMANAPLLNATKVAEIKQAISEGRFTVNSGVVADRLIETVQNLIKSQKT